MFLFLRLLTKSFALSIITLKSFLPVNHNLLNSNGDNLISLLLTYGFTNHISLPTRVTKNHQSLIDVLYSNQPDLLNSTEVVGCPFSDHRFVLASFNIKCQKQYCSVYNSRSLNLTKLNQIKAFLSTFSFTFLDSFVSVNDRWSALCKTLLDIVDTFAPVKQLRSRKRSLEWIDREVQTLMHKRDKLYRLACASGLPREDPIWDSVRYLRNKCKSLVRTKMKEYFADKSASFFKNSQKFWKFYRSNGIIQDKSSSTPNNISSILDSSNILLTDSTSIANTFNNHFTNLKPTINFSQDECSDFINNSFTNHKRLGNLKNSSFSFSKISDKEVLALF